MEILKIDTSICNHLHFLPLYLVLVSGFWLIILLNYNSASTEIIIEACLAVICFYIFVVHSLTSQNPFLNLKLFLDRNFTLGCITAFAMGWLSYTPIVLFPPLLQELRGYPDSLVGYLIAARGFGNWLSFFIVVQFTRKAPRLALAVGLACQAVAGWEMGQLSINLTEFDVFWTNCLQGFGFG